jgi:hypothetical protein
MREPPIAVVVQHTRLMSDAKRYEILAGFSPYGEDEMKEIMKEAADKCYDLPLDLCSPRGVDIIHNLKQRDQVPEWDDPEVRIY